MPLSVNVGLSRKASKDYQSTGVSINVTAELDQALLAKPAELQQQIGDLYNQAQRAMELQVGHMSTKEPQRLPERSNGNGQPRASASGDRYPSSLRRPSNNGSTATDSQRRAINAIARRVGVDPAVEARDVIGVELEQLTLRQASDLIDHLKALTPADDRNGR